MQAIAASGFEGVRGKSIDIGVQRSLKALGKSESLTFTVRAVKDHDTLARAVKIRQMAYARHLPQFAEKLGQPEEADFDENSVVLLAESKLDGSALGTMRIMTNSNGPLALERSLSLPEQFAGKKLAEATRLGVMEGVAGQVCKTALFKGFYQYCKANGVWAMVITARFPLDRHYDRLLFTDVREDAGFVPMKHVSDIPHRVKFLEVDQVEPLWAQHKHPLYDYFFNTFHPDIDTEIRVPLAATVEPVGRPVHAMPERRMEASMS
jgi:hypothetical protein